MSRFVSILMLPIIALLTLSFSFLKFMRTRDYQDMAKEIRANVAKKMTKKHQMDWIGEGGGMMGSVYMVKLCFQIHHPLDRHEARERLVDCVEELLKAINSNEEIRPYLKYYPFTIKNVIVVIFSDYPDGRDVYDPYISVVSISESDHITFRTEEPGKRYGYKNTYLEPYSNALTMVKGETGRSFQLSKYR